MSADGASHNITSASISAALGSASIGEDIYALAADIFPICRSIAGPGVRETLNILKEHVPLKVRAIESGTPILDWVAPKEWVIRDAYIKNAAGERVVDFQKNNLHVLNYSIPFSGTLPLSELKQNIFTLPQQPDLIPYRTSYYAEKWGFCASQNALDALPDGNYEVMIDASIEDGVMNYGEFVHKGESKDEFLFSTHICHPSLANDNCAGLALLALLAKNFAGLKTRYTYRFLWTPGTIGGIAWLAQNERGAAKRIKNGLVLSCVGDGGGYTYKRTRAAMAPVDRVMARTLRRMTPKPNIIPFFPYGYDERQYNSPGFKLNVGLFQRSQFASFPEYHTSGDNMDFIKPQHLAESYRVVAAAIEALEQDRRYVNLAPKGEPQLGRRGLYAAIGGDKDGYAKNMAMLWILNLSDGETSLADIAERSNTPLSVIEETAALLEEKGLLQQV